MTILKCDHCGVDSGCDFVKKSIIAWRPWEHNYRGNEYTLYFDLCKDCHKKLTSLLMPEPK